MLDWQPLFTGTPDAARDLAHELGRCGLRCFVQDLEGIQAPVGSRQRWSVVLVPPEENEAAQALVARWHAQNERDATRLVTRIRRVLLLGPTRPPGTESSASATVRAGPEPRRDPGSRTGLGGRAIDAG